MSSPLVADGAGDVKQEHEFIALGEFIAVGEGDLGVGSSGTDGGCDDGGGGCSTKDGKAAGDHPPSQADGSSFAPALGSCVPWSEIRSKLKPGGTLFLADVRAVIGDGSVEVELG